jgi:vitamin B12 transporter
MTLLSLQSSAPKPRHGSLRRGLTIGLLATALTPLSVIESVGQNPESEATEPLPTIVVSPTLTPTPVQEVGSSVTVVPATGVGGGAPVPGVAATAAQSGVEIERDQRRTAPEALTTVPGLHVFQQGGPGTQTSVFTRGTDPRHTKVLIDGIDMSDPSTPARTFELGHLTTADIERIEVLRGPQSGLYGADALGGVISITTKRGEGPAKVSGTVEGGSFGTFNQFASLSGALDKFDYAFNVAHLRSTNVPVTPPELLPPGRLAIANFYDNVTLSTKLGYQFNEDVRANVVARYTDSILRFTGDDFSVFPSVPAAAQSTQFQKTFATRGELEWALFDGRWKNFFGISYLDHRRSEIAPDPATYRFNGDRVKTDWRGQIALAPNHTLVVGAEAEKERLSTDATQAENGNKGTFVELQSSPFRNFFVVANVRYDNNDRFGGHVTWRVAPTYIFAATGTRLKGSVGTGFKAPTLEQLFVDYPAFNAFGNPNLRPEKNFGFDVGFEQPVLGGRIRFGATYFNNDLSDLIVGTFDSMTFISSYDNLASARTQGVETFIAVAVTDRFRIRGDYTSTDAVDSETGLELIRRPRHKASLTAAWNPYDPLTLSATVLHVGSWIERSRDFTELRLVAPGHTVVNVAANYTVSENVKVFARADNLFDVRYQSPTGFLRPGRGVYAGMKVTN